MKLKFTLTLLALSASMGAAHAQLGSNPARQTARGGANGAVFPLPAGVRKIISIDAYNVLMVEVDGPDKKGGEYAIISIQHVYSGGIARLFGGTTVPTEQFVSPGALGGGNGGNNRGAGFGVQGVGGNNGNLGGQTGNLGNQNNGNLGNLFGQTQNQNNGNVGGNFGGF